MKIPLEWLKEYIDTDLSTKELGGAFTAIGLMTDKPFDGKVFDLEHRFDRSDWLSILGCARDLAAYLGVKLKLPKVYSEEGKKPQEDKMVKIEVECPNSVNRFNTRVFRNIQVKDSPEWLKNRLEEYGIPSINNVVDITNYVMVELGQPMHAQDLKKFRKQEIIIRNAKSEEKLVTFLGDEVTLYPEAFVLTQDGVATVLGGIVGGRETGVDHNTTDIVLDAGNYNQNVIRRVSRKLKIQNETVLRYDKFLHPNLTQYAIERATFLILELAGGEYYQNTDWNPKESKPKEMHLRKSRILQLAGFEITNEKVLDIITRLGYQILEQDSNQYKVVVPYFRTDVEVEDDIVSDILRINGYTKIPTTQILSSPPKDLTPEIYTFEERLRDLMVNLEGHEHITDPTVSLNENQAGNQIELENSQNSQKNALRIEIKETLGESVLNYTKNQIHKGVLFEIGKVYAREGDRDVYNSYKETRVLECLVFDKDKTPKDLQKQTSKLLSTLLRNLGVNQTIYIKGEKENTALIYFEDVLVGKIRYNGFTIYTESALAKAGNIKRVVSDILTTNSLETSLIAPRDVPVGKIINTIRKSSDKIVDVEFIEEYTGKEVGKDSRSILLKTTFQQSLSAAEGTDILEKSLEELKKSYSIKIRG